MKTRLLQVETGTGVEAETLIQEDVAFVGMNCRMSELREFRATEFNLDLTINEILWKKTFSIKCQPVFRSGKMTTSVSGPLACGPSE